MRKYLRKYSSVILACKNKEKNYRCDKCEKSFGKMSTLKRHKEAIHDKIKKYKCDFCKADFSDKRWLKLHLINQHNSMSFSQ